MNPENELVETYQKNYTANLASGTTPATNEGSVEHLLEKIQAFLKIGWDSSAAELADEYEERTGLDFEELVEETTMNPYLKDPRGDD